ncbi:MAG TPA: DNA mismatch repair protein MutS [Pseudothermotoga sp.]|nr:DNA mismatch repair protein MutS [Pseudothermotoga sp.]HOK83535.1 DNA mismatch repair protein MutS [Pseudothermotoga sp.]HPP69608.1 DNA mismatch repair protein MutS [Pseudothermotoga sp.]
MKLTPMMQQYMQIKSKYKDAVLLFRLGDFYEAFFEDAQLVSKVLDLVLTHRQGAPMAGVPYHAVNVYLKKLVQAGYKVAICDQLEDPALAKGLVKREVTRIITPGTVLEDELLEQESNNYLVAICRLARYSVAGVDASTGESFAAAFDSLEATLDFLDSIRVSQILCDPSLRNDLDERFGNIMVEPLSDWHLSDINIEKDIAAALGVSSIDHLELGENLQTFAALIRYLRFTLMANDLFVKPPKILRDQSYVFLDPETIEHLGLLPGEKGKNLFDVLNFAKTPMGTRLLKSWIVQPLRDINKIEERLDKVEALINDQLLLNEVREYLGTVKDIQRIAGRIRYAKVSPKDLVALRHTLSVCPYIKEVLLSNESFSQMAQIDCLEDLRAKLDQAIEEDPSAVLGEGKVIKAGYDKELDDLRELVYHSQEFLIDFEKQERLRTNIPNLKVGYNTIFGYYIEVTRSHLSKIPKNYIRKQTLVNAERFVTEELKKFEERMLTAKEKLEKREKELYEKLCSELSGQIDSIVKLADFLAHVDVLSALAYAAMRYGYTRPKFQSDGRLCLRNSRHPVIERLVDDFVPNDLLMDQSRSFVILTGPNMSGKSTFIRQVALIALMAQIGSFVPAEEAVLPVFDRIFAKMGVRDDITSGKSTFLVEMNEVAKIIYQATKDSLVVLDEVGRGTSTFDGISIAWAVSEYIHNQIGCKCIFATHFTELTELARLYEGVENKTIQVIEDKSGVTFLHKVIEGVADKSYGIEVAAIAGLPRDIVQRAKEVLDVIATKSELEDKLRVVSSEKLKRLKRKKVHPDQSALW